MLLADNYSALHLYPIQLEPTINRKLIFERLRESGIGVNVHYIPVHTQPYYLNMGFKESAFPVALAYYQQTISLPMYSSLQDIQQQQVVSQLQQMLIRLLLILLS